jgi:hypothetical protein
MTRPHGVPGAKVLRTLAQNHGDQGRVPRKPTPSPRKPPSRHTGKVGYSVIGRQNLKDIWRTHMNSSKSVFYLIILLTMAQMTSGCARPLQTEGWANWNAASPSLLPAEQWRQYETPEEAGWSSEKLSAVQEMTNQAGSATVMVIYNGAILSQWGQTD